MIDEIQVRDLALIREANLVPSRGLTVLTGETGAGKTALLSALKLLMGVRASAELVRDGEDGLTVSGRFFGLRAADAGEGGGESDETVVVRRVSADGRSRASVDGTMASVRELGDLVGPSIDLCGQFEHQQLMRPSSHMAILDAWAGQSVADALREYSCAFADAENAANELTRVHEMRESSSAMLDEARFTLARIDEVAPQDGEYEQLQHDLEIAEHAETLATAVSTAHAALAGDAGALDALNVAASALEGVGQVDPALATLASSLREAGYVLEDVAAETRDYRDRVDFDPDELIRQQERFSQLQGLLRSYGPRMEDVFARRDEAAELIAVADDSDEWLVRAESRVRVTEEVLAAAADALDAARLDAAPGFAAEVTSIMSRLEMGAAELVCSQNRKPRESWTKTGPSDFEFLYRPATGTQPRPLARIASGGEVSRVMLAMKVVLGANDDVDTLVFDEVDAGVGGAVAVSLAEVIADLAETHQVIVVTHLAQVAVRGDAHYVVRRAGDETRLSRVERSEREREIARMLSGSATDVSLAHARELLGSSRSQGEPVVPAETNESSGAAESAEPVGSAESGGAVRPDEFAEPSDRFGQSGLIDVTNLVLRPGTGKVVVLRDDDVRSSGEGGE